MQKHPRLTLERIRLFAARELAGLLYGQRAPVQLTVYHAPGRISYEEAMRGDYAPVNVGQRFGEFWSTHWFRVQIEVPGAWAGQEVHLLWDSSSEAQVWQDGRPLQGLTGSASQVATGPVRAEYPLLQPAKGGEQIELYIEMAVNNLFGLGVMMDPLKLGEVGHLRQAEIAVFDREAWDLVWDYRVVADMATNLPENSPRGAQALFAANEMVNAIDPQDRATWPAARQIAKRFLTTRNGEGQLNLSAIGHAHIDTAWLWPLAETRRKCVRTFSTAVQMMEEYPEYQFACSQAQQLEWIKQDQPDLWRRIQQRVKSGQFVPVGGSWVEPDCNLPSGESLVRQFLYGQRFFRREFGITCREFWEPDVFGYSAALPQILKQCAMDYFLTIKLSWNQFNKLSAHTFWWEGLDGSQVLTHFPPADTYNADASVRDVHFSMTNYKDLDRSKEAYLLFGFGDGGGGPTRDMLEQLRRMEDVDGLPRVAMRPAGEFFTRLHQDARQLLTWSGELYFELHRGTYTTQAGNKRYNRQSEFMLHEVEFLSAVANHLAGLDYPTQELDRLWKLVLTSQFHDIIPGSSINEVYRDSNEHYQQVLGSGAALRNQAISALLGAPAAEGGRLAVINTLGFERSELVELPEGQPGAQVSAEGHPLGVVSAPPYGYAILEPTSESSQTVTVREEGQQFILENDFVRAVFGRDGALTSLLDKRLQRESIQPGEAGNRFVLFEDTPNSWDAWDVDIFHLEKPLPMSGAHAARVLESGPLRVALAFDYQISPNSTIQQKVMLTAISPRLDFACEVAWHERHRFLKVEFPLNVRAASATYEVQFGHVQRPTHFNTSWDMARFEVPAHRWADLSDPAFGVALLNDSKYGYSTHGSRMRLSLLRSTTAPDPEADQGLHLFHYALLPHTGGPQTGGVIEAGYQFNVPLLLYPTAGEPVQRSFFQVDNPALVLDTIKQAEDSQDIIVRLYEARGTHGTAVLRSSLPVRSAARVNLLEDETAGQTTSWSENGLSFDFRPFEIITFKLGLA